MKENLSLPKGYSGRVWRLFYSGNPYTAHRHEELEINLITRGRAGYLLGDRKYELHRHDLVWLFPGQEHVLLNQSKDLAMWILVFKPEAVKRVSQYPGNATLRELNPAGDFCRRVTDSQYQRLEELFEEINTAEADVDRYNAGLAYALTLSWAAHCASATLSPFSGVHPCVEQAARLLRDVDEPLDLSRLARRVGMSPSRLSRLFKEQTGVALTVYRNSLRLERFCELYDSGNFNLHEAALQAGFGSYPQFHRVFKASMGFAPIHRRGKNDKEIKEFITNFLPV
jgi:AraC-like DNA-binding protein